MVVHVARAIFLTHLAACATRALKGNRADVFSMPSLCPLCLGSGMNLNRGGHWQFASGSATRCGRCDGKGWLEDSVAVDSLNPVEHELVLDMLKHYSPANIDDIARLTGLDIPAVHRALVSLRDKGLVGVEDGSPVLYYLVKGP
jgi:hypothetical protein